MKTFAVKFVAAGSDQLRTSLLSLNNSSSVNNFIQKKYGYCTYLEINEL
jgi:hypothetical protein